MSSNPLQKKGEGREIFFLEDWKKGSEVSEILEGIPSSWRFAVIIWKISVRPEEEVKRSEETGREDFSTDSSLLPHHRFFINFPLKKFDSSEERGGRGAEWTIQIRLQGRMGRRGRRGRRGHKATLNKGTLHPLNLLSTFDVD